MYRAGMVSCRSLFLPTRSRALDHVAAWCFTVRRCAEASRSFREVGFGWMMIRCPSSVDTSSSVSLVMCSSQARLNGFNALVLGGCNLTRDIEHLVRQAGFTFEKLDKYYVEGDPKFVGWVTRGVARKASAMA
jgi:hypothetical protein